MGEKHGFDKPLGGFANPKPVTESSKWLAHFVAMTAEFVGTFMFLLLAFLGHEMAVSQQADTAANGGNNNSTIIYIALSYGLSLLVSAWTMYRISGGLFNPAVTFGLVITGTLPPLRGLLLLPPQIIAAICAAAVASGIVPGDIARVQTTLAPKVSTAQGLFLEMFLTAELVFTILMLAGEKHKGTFIAPIGIGLALFMAEIAGVYYTGASLNPARSFGPCVVAGNFQSYHYIYWIGPLLGALISGGYYHFVKFFDYEEANPGQDSAGGDFEEATRSTSEGNVEAQLEKGNSRREYRNSHRDSGDARRNNSNSRRDYSNSRRDPRNSHRDNRNSRWENGNSHSQTRQHFNSRRDGETLHPGYNNY